METKVARLPWHYEGFAEDRDGNFMAEKIVGSNGVEPVYAGQCEWEGTLCFNSKEEASLIAAAPELLAAAKAAIVHLRACEKGEISHPFKSASLPMLEQAVAKAEVA